MDHTPKKSSNARELLDALFSAPLTTLPLSGDSPGDFSDEVQPVDSTPPKSASAIVRAVPTTYKKSRLGSLPPEIRAAVIARSR